MFIHSMTFQKEIYELKYLKTKQCLVCLISSIYYNNKLHATFEIFRYISDLSDRKMKLTLIQKKFE